MTDDLSPAAREDLEHWRAKQEEAARQAAEAAARKPPRINRDLDYVFHTVGLGVGKAIRPMQKKIAELETQLRDKLADLLGELLYKIRRDEIRPLERRLAEIEGRVLLDFKGPWRAGEKYAQGDCVQWKGALWVALASAEAKPGESRLWRLAVKSNREQPHDPNMD